MNTKTPSALALLFLLLVQAANAAEPPIPPSEALSDFKLQELTGQKAPLLRPPQVSEVVPGALAKFPPRPQRPPPFKWPRGGCIPHPPGR